MDIYLILSCRTGALTPGGRHFVRYWASRGRSRWSRTEFQGSFEYE
jgi:hypothetical protein